MQSINQSISQSVNQSINQSDLIFTYLIQVIHGKSRKIAWMVTDSQLRRGKKSRKYYTSVHTKGPFVRTWCKGDLNVRHSKHACSRAVWIHSSRYRDVINQLVGLQLRIPPVIGYNCTYLNTMVMMWYNMIQSPSNNVLASYMYMYYSIPGLETNGSHLATD